MIAKIRQTIEDRGNQHVGLLAEFDNPGELVHAVEGLREKGYTQIDTFTPFPIHGMDRAMGLGVSPLGFMVFAGGVTGLLAGIFLQWYTSAGPQPTWVDTILQGYPINISNKPLFAWESSVPIMFELTILLSALTAVGGMIALNGLPKPYNPLFHSDRFGAATDDAFFAHVSVRDRSFDRNTTLDDLRSLGASHVEYIDHDGATVISPAGDDVHEPVEVDQLATAGDVPRLAPPHTTGDI